MRDGARPRGAPRANPTANRLLQIEPELGNRARFLGKAGLKP